jgi:hypothetical protein
VTSISERSVESRIGFGVILVFYLFLSLIVFNQIEEDAFIYFRLADNIAQGYGAVFNRGGLPVEVGSSLLWLFLLVLFRKVPLDIVITAKLLGVTMGGLGLWLVYRLCRLHIRDPLLRLAPPLITAASTPFLMWSQRGLDTPVFVALVLWLVLCCSDPKNFRWWPVPGVLLLPARPEGFFFLLALLPAFAFHRRQWMEIARSLLVVGVAAMALLAARFMYFHDLVPLPFYVKLGTTLEGRPILRYLSGSHLSVFALPLLVVAWRPSFWTRERIVLGGFVLITAAWCAIAKDYMPYVRHLVPAIPLLYVLLTGAVDVLARGRAGWRRALAIAYMAIVLFITLLLSESPWYFGEGRENRVAMYIAAFAVNPLAHLRQSAAKIVAPMVSTPLDETLGRECTLGTNYQALVGEFLRRNYPANARVVYDQMGQTPFYAGPDMEFIDSGGLTDRTISRAYFERRKRHDAVLRAYDAGLSTVVRLVFGEHRDEITEAMAVDYLFGLDADVILINKVSAAFDAQGIPARLDRDSRITRDYDLRYSLAAFASVKVYEKKNAPRKPKIDAPVGLQVTAY